MYKEYNDFELIYLIRDSDEYALNLMYEKYTPFIYKVMKGVNVYSRYEEEFLQEGYMCLHTAIKTFDMDFNKTFFKYFEVILKRRFYRLIKVYSKIDIPIEDIEESLEEKTTEYNHNNIYEIGLSLLTDELEKGIYISLYQDGLSYNDTANKYNVSIKKIYNTVQKIKKILNKNINY